MQLLQRVYVCMCQDKWRAHPWSRGVEHTTPATQLNASQTGRLRESRKICLVDPSFPCGPGDVLWEMLIWAHTPAGLGEPMMVISIFGGKIFVENKTKCVGMFGRLMTPTNLPNSSCPSAALVTPHSSEDITCR